MSITVLTVFESVTADNACHPGSVWDTVMSAWSASDLNGGGTAHLNLNTICGGFSPGATRTTFNDGLAVAGTAHDDGTIPMNAIVDSITVDYDWALSYTNGNVLGSIQFLAAVSATGPTNSGSGHATILVDYGDTTRAAMFTPGIPSWSLVSQSILNFGSPPSFDCTISVTNIAFTVEWHVPLVGVSATGVIGTLLVAPIVLVGVSATCAVGTFLPGRTIPQNGSPIINAGQDQVLTPPIPSTATVVGTFVHAPPTGSTITYAWSFVSGPAGASAPSITSPTSLTTAVVFSQHIIGTYIFRLTSSGDSDMGVPASSDLIGIVIPVPRPPSITT